MDPRQYVGRPGLPLGGIAMDEHTDVSETQSMARIHIKPTDRVLCTQSKTCRQQNEW